MKNIRTLTEDEARTRLAEGLGWPGRVPDLEWEAVKDLRGVRRFMAGEDAEGSALVQANQRLDELKVERPLKVEHRSTRSPKDKMPDYSDPADLRCQLISILHLRIACVIFAEELEFWYEKWGKSKRPEQVANWLNYHSLKDEEDKEEHLHESGEPAGWLEFGAMDDPWFHRVPYFCPDSFPGYIARISDRIAQVMGWTQGEASSFLICRHMPIWKPTRVEIDHHSLFPAQTRIRMSISPLASPREVMEAYAKARRQLFTGRDKPMAAEKLHQILDVFVHGVPDQPWSNLWETHAKDNSWRAKGDGRPTYKDSAKFKHEMKSAVNDVLDPLDEMGGFWGRYAVGDMSAEQVVRAAHEFIAKARMRMEIDLVPPYNGLDLEG